jgi:hypothetical protein
VTISFGIFFATGGSLILEFVCAMIASSVKREAASKSRESNDSLAHKDFLVVLIHLLLWCFAKAYCSP